MVAKKGAGKPQRKTRVLIGKPGLDGHDVGAKVIVRALMEAGCEVIYSGLRRPVEAIVKTALEEDVDVIGLSIMSGAHLPICEKMKDLLDKQGLSDRLWIVGGNIPAADRQKLLDIGVNAVFATGSRFDDVAQFVLEHAPSRS